MAAEYFRVKKKKNFGGSPRQEIQKIEICTWNKNTIFFLILRRLPSEIPKIIKKYSFLAIFAQKSDLNLLNK